MAWQSVPTVALDVDSGIAPARAHAITEALYRRIIALLVNRRGRAEPLASACLYWSDGHLILLTCRHVFDDGVSLGDLALPLGDSGRLIALHALRARFVEHPGHDVAAIDLCPVRARDALQRHWFPVPLYVANKARRPTSDRLVIAGYPYAQMRRIDGAVYARPLVFFARPMASPVADVRAGYARTAMRIDGVLVHAPALDGVSGATVWSIEDERQDVECLLWPAGVQCAFKHDEYVRGEPMAAAREVVARLVGR
ncbi:MAG TPA: hypothetical protein VMG60_22955 [Burkholderiaceae bacterium]|nr:hypothetical protein [Burkholderiaceae bacterium]